MVNAYLHRECERRQKKKNQNKKVAESDEACGRIKSDSRTLWLGQEGGKWGKVRMRRGLGEDLRRGVCGIVVMRGSLV